MAEIFSIRGCGNTTRQVDDWIQELFTNGEVEMTDHAYNETNRAQNHAYKIIRGRLFNEHHLTVGEDYTYNYNTHILKLKKPL